MSSETSKKPFWKETCDAARMVRAAFGLENALQYLVGDKLFTYLSIAERDTGVAAEMPFIIMEVKRIFTASELKQYLDRLDRTKYARKKGRTELAAREVARFLRIRELFE
jgi:hypothetical protein